MAIGPSMHYGATSVASSSLASHYHETDPAPARDSQIPSEMRLLHAAIAELESDWNLLAQWLAPVLPEGKSESCPENCVDEYRVPLANDIRRARRNVERLIGLVRTASQHIEL